MQSHQTRPLNTDPDLPIPPCPPTRGRAGDFRWADPHESGLTRHEYAYRRMLSTAPPTNSSLAVEVGCGLGNVSAWWRVVRPRTAEGKPLPRVVPVVTGATVRLPRFDGARVWEKLLAAQAEYEAAQAGQGPNDFALPAGTGAVGLAFMGDLHIGGNAYYREMLDDANRVADHGMYACLLGDYLNNWVIGKLAGEQRDELVRHGEAIAAFKHWLGIVGPSLMSVVGGNHDAWSDIAGLDYIRPELERVNPDCLFDPGRLYWTLRLGACEKRLLMQHVWRGNSMLNQTHAIERAAHYPLELDVPPFDIGAAGHRHTVSVVRPFIVGESHPRMAVQVGTYKRNDRYGKSRGFAVPMGLGACSVVIEESGMMSGFPNVELGASFLEERRKAWGVA